MARRWRWRAPLAAVLLVELTWPGDGVDGAIAGKRPGHAELLGQQSRRLDSQTSDDVCVGVVPSQLLDHLMALPAYRHEEHPGAHQGTPTVVEQQIHIEKIVAVNEREGSFVISGYWRTWWVDSRLAHGTLGAPDCVPSIDISLKPNLQGAPQPVADVWTPRLFFDNALEESYAAYSFQVFPSGQTKMNIKFLHKFGCSMNFGRIPFDRQLCKIRIMPYKSDNTEVRLSSKDGVFVTMPLDKAGNSLIQTKAWKVMEAPSQVMQESYGTGADALSWDVMEIELRLSRRATYHIKKDVLYGVLFVVLSYVGFWIDNKSSPARAAMAVIPVLTMLNHVNNVDSTLPPLSSSTWLNTFLLVSLVYTVLAVVELCVVSYFLREEELREERLGVFEKLARRMAYGGEPLTDREEKMVKAFFKMVIGGIGERISRHSPYSVDELCGGSISARALHRGLRSFNVYWSLEQCCEAIPIVEHAHLRRSCEGSRDDSGKSQAKSAAKPTAVDTSPTDVAVMESTGIGAEGRRSGSDSVHSVLAGGRSNSVDDSLSADEFRTFIVMLEQGFAPTPPTRQRLFDRRPSAITDAIARKLFLPSYILVLVFLFLTVSLYPAIDEE